MRLQKILQRREKQGDFKSIEDILELDGFGIKVLEKFCNSILQSNIDVIKKEEAAVEKQDAKEQQALDSFKNPQFISPAMLEYVRESISTVVSFHADLNYFAWTKFYFNRNEKLDIPMFCVEEWNCCEMGNQEKKLRLPGLVEQLVKLSHQIPHADVYVMESLPIAVQAKQPGSALQVNLNIQKTQFVAMLSVLMASRSSLNKLITKKGVKNESVEDTERMAYYDSVYFLRNFLPSRFYKILIGNERVSSGMVVENIINYNYGIENLPFNPTYSSVSLPSELRENWKHSDHIHKEYLGNSMLAGLTFLKLCVHKCNKSISSLSRSKK